MQNGTKYLKQYRDRAAIIPVLSQFAHAAGCDPGTALIKNYHVSYRYVYSAPMKLSHTRIMCKYCIATPVFNIFLKSDNAEWARRS